MTHAPKIGAPYQIMRGGRNSSPEHDLTENLAGLVPPIFAATRILGRAPFNLVLQSYGRGAPDPPLPGVMPARPTGPRQA
jgi:hypothetical protein